MPGSGPSTQRAPADREWVKAVVLAVTVSYVGLALLFLQFSVPSVTEEDGCYHVGMAQVLREHGITRQFEWTPLSVWSERYSDKELLFHVALAPFASGEPDRAVTKAKVFISVLGFGVFMVFAWVLWRHEVPAVWLWCLVLMGASYHWLFRLTQIRSHVLSIALALVGVHWLLRRRWWALAALGFVYAWSYSAPQVLLAIALVITVSRRIGDGAWEWRGLLATAGGLAAGSVIHPYFPNNLLNWWIQNVWVLLHAWGLWGPPELILGGEFRPASSWMLIEASTLGLAVFIAANLGAAMSRRRASGEALAVLSLSWAFLLLELMSERFVEYFVPVAVLAGALVVRDALAAAREAGDGSTWPGSRGRRVAAGIALAAVVAFSNYRVFRELPPNLDDYPRWEVGASRWLRENVPSGELVLFPTFDQFPALFLRDREHRYPQAMDPMFSYASHPEQTLYLSRLWLAPSPPPPAEIAERMGGRYMVVRKPRWPQYRLLLERGARLAYEDEETVVVDLTPAAAG